jgi:hypothetical protein
MKSLEHAKGPSWVRQNGIDMNLGGYGDQRRSINNRLTFIEEIHKSSDNDSIKVVCGAKGVGGSGRRDRLHEKGESNFHMWNSMGFCCLAQWNQLRRIK